MYLSMNVFSKISLFLFLYFHKVCQTFHPPPPPSAHPIQTAPIIPHITPIQFTPKHWQRIQLRVPITIFSEIRILLSSPLCSDKKFTSFQKVKEFIETSVDTHIRL